MLRIVGIRICFFRPFFICLTTFLFCYLKGVVFLYPPIFLLLILKMFPIVPVVEKVGGAQLIPTNPKSKSEEIFLTILRVVKRKALGRRGGMILKNLRIRIRI